MIQGDFSLHVLIFPALPNLSAQSRLMTISTLKTLKPVENTERAKTTGLELTSFSLKPNCLLLLNRSHTGCSICQCKHAVKHMQTHTLHNRTATPGSTVFRSLCALPSRLAISSVLILSGSSQHPSPYPHWQLLKPSILGQPAPDLTPHTQTPSHPRPVSRFVPYYGSSLSHVQTRSL